tara:strand:- start:847 stop:1008 length:162 start_codon:yes stop_codon:yes gene_type:complete
MRAAEGLRNVVESNAVLTILGKTKTNNYPVVLLAGVSGFVPTASAVVRFMKRV